MTDHDLLIRLDEKADAIVEWQKKHDGDHTSFLRRFEAEETRYNRLAENGFPRLAVVETRIRMMFILLGVVGSATLAAILDMLLRP